VPLGAYEKQCKLYVTSTLNVTAGLVVVAGRSYLNVRGCK